MPLALPTPPLVGMDGGIDWGMRILCYGGMPPIIKTLIPCITHAMLKLQQQAQWPSRMEMAIISYLLLVGFKYMENIDVCGEVVPPLSFVRFVVCAPMV